MIGTIVNTAAIVMGGTAGLLLVKNLSPAREVQIKQVLGILTVWVGLSMTWTGLNGTVWQIARQMLVVVLSLMLGHLTGRLLGIQKMLNSLGQYAKQRLTSSQPADHRFAEGFITCSLLYCVGPLSILGSLQDGLYQNPRTLLIKSCMDGLASVAFARTFGGGVLLSALPVFTYQGTLTLLAQFLAPLLQQKALLDSIGATGGLLVFSVALVILELGRIELANYLPSLLYAPLLTWLWRFL